MDMGVSCALYFHFQSCSFEERSILEANQERLLLPLVDHCASTSPLMHVEGPEHFVYIMANLHTNPVGSKTSLLQFIDNKTRAQRG